MQTIFVSPDFPLNRRMRKAVKRGKLHVVREGGRLLTTGREMPSGLGRGLPACSSPLVCRAEAGGTVGGGTVVGNEVGGGNGSGLQISQGICTLTELLSGEIRLSLPFYQREYTWKAKHCDELWRDVVGVVNRPGISHYMGSLTLEPLPDAGIHRIIDGQQRLISLCLMAGACIRKLRGAGSAADQARADEIARLFLVNGDDPRNGEDMKVRMLNLDGHDDHDYFRELVLGNTGFPRANNPVQENLRAAARGFLDRFKDLKSNQSRFEFMRVHAGSGLLFAPVVLPPEADGHRVYATLNFRGLPLTAAHVVKAHLLAEVAKSELQTCATRWADLLKKVGGKPMVEFLCHAFNAQHKHKGKSVQPDGLPDAIKDLVSESDPSKVKVMDYLNDLDKKSVFFQNLLHPTMGMWGSEDHPYVRFLANSESRRQVTPLLMSAHEGFSSSDFSRVLRMCEVALVRLSMVGQQFPSMIAAALDSAVKIHPRLDGEQEITNYAELYDCIFPFGVILPSDDDFGGGRGILRKFPVAVAEKQHYLARMEQCVSGGEFPSIPPAHIMSLLTEQELPPAMSKNLANLVLWENGTQQEFSAMSYEQRVEVLRSSEYHISREIAERWPQKPADMLGERGQRMGEIAVRTWNLNG